MKEDTASNYVNNRLRKQVVPPLKLKARQGQVLLGIEVTFHEGVHGAIVTGVRRQCFFWGKVQPGDCITRINDAEITNADDLHLWGQRRVHLSQ